MIIDKWCFSTFTGQQNNKYTRTWVRVYFVLPCNCKGILSCKRFPGYRQENTRRSTAEHKTDYGNTSVIRCGDQGAQKVFADDSRSASRSQWMTLASLGDCCFRSPQKLKICGDPIYRITRSEHRNFSPTRAEWADFERINTIYSITQRCIRLNKNKGLVLSPLFLFKSFGLTTEVIEHNHVIFYTEWVQEIKHSLWHHRRAARRKWLARRNSLGEFGLPHFLLSPKIKNFRGPRLLWVPLRLISHEKDSVWSLTLIRYKNTIY